MNWILQWGGSRVGSRVESLVCDPAAGSQTWRLDFHFPPRPAGSQLLHLVKAEIWFLTWSGRRWSRVSTLRARWITHGVIHRAFSSRWATWGGFNPIGGTPWGLTRDPAGEVIRPPFQFDYTRGGYPLRGTTTGTPVVGWSPWGGEDFLVRPRYV